MPFLVSEVVKETVTAVALSTAVSTAPVTNQVCFDHSFKLLGFRLGKEIITCFDKPIQGVVSYEPIQPALPPVGIPVLVRE